MNSGILTLMSVIAYVAIIVLILGEAA